MLKLYNMKVNLEGNYTSTYGFVGRNNLEKYAEMTFGKNWEAESDVEQIQLLCDYIDHGRYHVDCIDTRVEDVKGIFKCDDDQAQDVLDSALTNEATIDRIWFAIRFHADEYGLKELED
jgi:hypothetical protein